MGTFEAGSKKPTPKFTARGVGVKQLNHINLFSSDIDQNSQFMRTHSGCKIK